MCYMYLYVHVEEMIFGDDDPVTLEEVEDKMETAGVAHSAMMEVPVTFLPHKKKKH
jgi:hypothetical protein